MADLVIITAMFAFAVMPFFVMKRLIMAQKSGFALSFISVLIAGFTILIFASSTPIGMDPLRAIGIAMICLLPALVGAGAGVILGYILLHRRFKD